VCTLGCLAWIGLGGGGCRNFYQQAQARYPADACDRFWLRIEEAQHAGVQAEQASVQLAALASGSVEDLQWQAAVDRLETAARDLNRRIASARDVASSCQEAQDSEFELRRLEQQGEQFLVQVSQLRQGAPGPER
jgi:hypothetical protein